jgi:hypothetical protein
LFAQAGDESVHGLYCLGVGETLAVERFPDADVDGVAERAAASRSRRRPRGRQHDDEHVTGFAQVRESAFVDHFADGRVDLGVAERVAPESFGVCSYEGGRHADGQAG